MRKKPTRLRFKAYLGLIAQGGLKNVLIVLAIMQFFAGWGAIAFAFVGTFSTLVFIENQLGIRLL